jgi:outer membrane receptor for ferrienterochelin and colicin
MRRLQFCLAVFALLALTCSGFAQVQNGQFTGTVTDPSGAAVPNAKVTVSSQATGLSVTTTTNQSGNYTVKELPIGTYKLTAEASGFKTVSDTNVVLNAGVIAHVDFKMALGQAKEVIEVTGALAQVNTEDSKLASTVTSTQINALPLNGRNVFDLMQISTGAVNVSGVDFENGHGTVVNGVREDFNGFLINGVSNKGLSGGVVNVPIQDSVEEFQQLQLNMSAQYGNSAGGTVNLVTKSGTNNFHGSAWEYLRNDALDANNFFLNQVGTKKPPLHFNQFGVTVGGPIIKDKLFFFLSLQGDRFTTSGVPITDLQETKTWRDAVIQANANAANAGDPINSVSSLLYGNFAPNVPGTGSSTLTLSDDSVVPFTANNYVRFFNGQLSADTPDYSPFLCPGGAGTDTQVKKWQYLFGTTTTSFGCSAPLITGALSNLDAVIQENSSAIFKTQTGSSVANANLFNGNEASLRLDYNWNSNNRFFLQYNYNRQTDKFGPCNASCTRGFSNPSRSNFPQGSLSFVHTFTPTILNEVRLGYLQNNTVISVNKGGVPAIGFSDGGAGFGSYNGYPQSFKENIYTYADMLSISHGNHNMKIGADFRRNIENSEFNVARPSYYFYDQVFFAADAPYYQAAGVDPGICKAPCPQSSYNSAPQAQLFSNFRHWRNLEFGAYFQDDWKVSKRLTLNLGIRYDLYQRHHELNDLATTFILGGDTPNAKILGPSNGLLNRLFNTSDPNNCANLALAQVVGGCGAGTGGFAPSKALGAGDHNNFGPRIGFAYDLFGNGKTSLRGGFGVAYEGTLYNPLSNSRWDPPYYSFNGIVGGVGVAGGDVVYGPSTCDPVLLICGQDSSIAPTFVGPPTNPFQGPAGQAQAQGNITGWDPNNPNFAVLTGIILPEGIKDPYVYNYYMSIQHELMPKTVLEVDYVGTTGHKLFRAEDINREPGSFLDPDVTVKDNLGRTLTGLGGRLNGNFGRLRNWRNSVNSNYNSLQTSVKHQMSHGLLFNVNYTYSHSIDEGSTWHSGATTANGSAAGEGFTLDQTLPGLDRGNSIFDIRHRLVVNYVYQLPGQNLKGALGWIAGGWSYNGIWSFQTGAHFEPFTSVRAHAREISNPKAHCTQADVDSGNCSTPGDFNLDGGNNDRVNASRAGISGITHDQWAFGWFAGGPPGAEHPVDISFSNPCLGCVATLGRNTFVGPGNWYADMALSKTFKFTERVNLKFDAQGFNVFNRANFVLATAGGGAHNQPRQSNFGTAAGTLNERQLQFGLKLSF